MMRLDRDNCSADQLYIQARARWVKVVDCNIYDNEDMLTSVAALLKKARQQNKHHLQSLVLLSDLMMVLGANREAMEIVEALVGLQPHNQTHARKKILLRKFQANQTDENRDAIRAFIESRWTETSDW
ncbi:MAG: hypothetical protein AAF579_05670 [Cyanobacteria bacterium P01_C01_bin.118]